MENDKKRTLDEFRADLVHEAPDAAPVLEVLDRTQLTIRRFEPALPTRPARNKAARTWLLFGEPDSALRERFDLAPELLVVLIPAREAQTRDIHAAEQCLLRDYRLDRGLVLVIAQDERARARLERQARETRRTYVFLSFADLTGTSDPQAWLRGVLLEHLGSSDLFAPGPPVVGWDFVGRRRELGHIRKHLRGGRPVGLYGLRKIGKTSLLFSLRKQLIDESRQSATMGDAADVTVPVYLDMQKISFLEQNRAGFLRELIRVTYDTLAELRLAADTLGLDPDLGKRKHKLNKLGTEETERAAVHMLELLVDWAIERPGQRRIFLLIDEYERLLDGTEFPQRDGLQILTYLRGLLQSHLGAFVFLIAGRSRQLACTSRFAGQQNPLLNLLIDFPLAGLEQPEMNQLISKIGRRLSLDFRDEALELIWRETGGHPFLAREFGRLIDKGIPARERNPRAAITAAIVAQLRARFQRQTRQTLENIAEAIATLDPKVLFTLSYVHAYPHDAGVAIAELPSSVLDELCRFGILQEQESGFRVRIGCFGDWVQQNYDSLMPSAAQG